VVLQRSNITTVAQLDKKRIGVGPRAGTGGTYVSAILKVLGISAVFDYAYSSYDEIASRFLDGSIDAIVTLSPPAPAFQKAAAKDPVTFIRLSPEQIEAVRKAMPEFSPSKLAAGT
jgi:TRAP-type uncharacterized transport system substrate-binding protein